MRNTIKGFAIVNPYKLELSFIFFPVFEYCFWVEKLVLAPKGAFTAAFCSTGIRWLLIMNSLIFFDIVPVRTYTPYVDKLSVFFHKVGVCSRELFPPEVCYDIRSRCLPVVSFFQGFFKFRQSHLCLNHEAFWLCSLCEPHVLSQYASSSAFSGGSCIIVVSSCNSLYKNLEFSFLKQWILVALFTSVQFCFYLLTLSLFCCYYYYYLLFLLLFYYYYIIL